VYVCRCVGVVGGQGSWGKWAESQTKGRGTEQARNRDKSDRDVGNGDNAKVSE
jgi:hypothetical protein